MRIGNWGLFFAALVAFLMLLVLALFALLTQDRNVLDWFVSVAVVVVIATLIITLLVADEKKARSVRQKDVGENTVINKQ